MDDLDTDLTVRRAGLPPGEGPLLVLLHGLTGSGAAWPDAWQHWGSTYSIVSVDQRGHGTSPRFTSEQLAGHPGEIMVEDAVALLAQLPDRPVVMGHSMGGAVALAAAVRRPELVRALVLEDPAPISPGEDARDGARGREFAESVQDSRAAADEDELLAVRRTQHSDWTDDELLASGTAEQQVDLAFLENGEYRPLTPWPDLFAQVAVPTLVVSGDTADEIVITDEHERGIAEIGNPRVRLVRVPGSGHCIRREQPAAYYAAVDAFLADVTR